MAQGETEGLMVPPWIEYPAMPRTSIGWRMGYGEEYWDEFRAWWLAQSPDVRGQMKAQYPEPPGWTGFYQDL